MRLAPIAALLLLISPAAFAETTGLGAIKSYLVGKVTGMTKAAHSYVAHAQAYDKIIQENHGDYNAAALQSGGELAGLVAKMQDDYKEIHNTGYETIEGIVAGVRPLVDYDTYLDAGVPKAEASTDSPPSPLVLKSADGKIISDRQGNLFHYVMEPTLWGTKPVFMKPLSPEASAKAKGMKALPRADVVLAAAVECSRKLDQLLAAAQKWQPTLDECVGALVWMTPTLNGYFEDWKDSRYNPSAALGRYVAESRVLDMRGIMFSLRLTYKAIQPEIAKKDPALAKKLESDYDGIMGFIDRVDARERKGKKLTVQEIEEMAFQAKSLTDQLVPKLKQVVALLGLKLPPKPILA
jgi:hypothetical protein